MLRRFIINFIFKDLGVLLILDFRINSVGFISWLMRDVWMY